MIDQSRGLMAGRLIDMTGWRFGRWLVLSRHSPIGSRRVKWLCRCDCGAELPVEGNILRRGESTQCRSCAHRKGEVICYHAAHIRIRIERGRASDHPCSDCRGPAREWSLRKDATAVHMGPNSNGSQCAYSLDANDYEPRCRRCHKLYDDVA